MSDDGNDPLWFKDALIYQLHVKSFFDSNNDGIGDFKGVIQKLDYLHDLGITTIWLMPFYPSPLRDDGYDIAHYRTVNPSFGDLRDVRLLIREAHARGLRVITELVINHTSDQHPWFQRARRAPRGSSLRNFYVWSDDDKKWPETRIIFNDIEPSNWTWDPVAGQFYWHRFFSHQPDLNFDNPRVMQAIVDTMKYWLNMGVDAFRMDAIPYLVERDGTNNESLPETHAVIKALRAAMVATKPDAFFLAEANQWPEDTLPYFGDGDECQMAFHFPLMPRMYMAMAQEDRNPITDIMRQTPEIPANCQWAIFLRNHDELTLEMVTARERDWMWQFYATDRRARLNMGIRRRLAPLMGNDRRKIELMNSLLFSMPGTPIIYYGDEIGMGDNFHLGDRDGVRTAMQWSPDRNGGFSRADPADLFLPPIMDPVYGFESVNVEAQQRSQSSLLNWMKRMIDVRQGHRAFGRGELTFLYPGNRKILAYLREYDGQTILCVANLSRRAQAVELDLTRFRGSVPVELLGRNAFPPIGDLPYLLTLPAYGFFWFILSAQADVPSWYEATPDPLPDLVTLVLKETAGWTDLQEGRTGVIFARDVVPPFIAQQRWFASKGARIQRARMIAGARLPDADPSILAAVIELGLSTGVSERYFQPLQMHWDETAVTTQSPSLPFTLARVRKGPRIGALVDATSVPAFALSMVEAMRRDAALPMGEPVLRCAAGPGLPDLALAAGDEIRRLELEHTSNTTILMGDKAVLKVYRKLEEGIHPELEIGRFLTERAGFAQVPPLLGSAVMEAADGTPTAIAMLRGYVRNQGDALTFAADYLQRELEEAGPPDIAAALPPAERFAFFLPTAALLGERTAALHRALASDPDDPDFRPEPTTAADAAAAADGVRSRADAAFAAIEQALPALPEPAQGLASRLLAQRDALAALLARLPDAMAGAAKTRLHGSFDLAQVLMAQGDFVFLDFEGEPGRTLAERRVKASPLHDVAGMVRSFDHVAVATVDRLTVGRPQRAAELWPLAAAWRDLGVAAFLDGYRRTIADAPDQPADPAALLDLLVLERILGEIAAEAAPRPERLPVLVAGALAILERAR